MVRIYEPHYQLAAIVGELEDLHVHAPPASHLGEPDVAFRIVRADVDLVGLVEERVPLGPVLDDVPVSIGNHHIVRSPGPLPPIPTPVTPHGHDDPVRVVDRYARHLPPGPLVGVIWGLLPPVSHGVVLSGPVVPTFHDWAVRSRLRGDLVLAGAGGEYRQLSGEDEG